MASADTGDGVAAVATPTRGPASDSVSAPPPSGRTIKVHPHPGTIAKKRSVIADVSTVINHEVDELNHFLHAENHSTMKKKIRAFLDDARSSREALYFAGE